MPSYLVSAKEAFVPVELYKPPIEALGDMLRIKQSQYMQGFNQVKSLYSSVLNKPVIGEQANAVKDKYLSDISNQLKDLPTLDLSNPSNVANAEAVFEPMLNDKGFTMARARASEYYSGISQAETYEYSDDEKKRAQYHPAAKQDLVDMAEEIAEAGTDYNKLSQVKSRKFTPFFDIKNDLIERFKNEKGMDVFYDEIQGNYIVRTKNGERSLSKYEIMAADVLNDPKYNAQLSVQSRVELNRQIRQVRGAMPGINREQARQQVINNLAAEADSYYTDLNQNLQNQASSLRENLKAMGPIETDPTKPGYDPRRLEMAQQYGSQISALDNKRNSIIGKKAEYVKGISVNPESYLSQRIMDGYAQSFARSRAANTSTEIKTNDVPFKQDDSARGWAAINLNVQKEVNDQGNIVNGLTGKGSGKVQLNPDGTVKMTAQQVKEAAVAPTMMGYELNTDSNKRTAFGVWNNYMGKISEKANGALLDVNNGMVVALSTVSADITPTDIMHFSSALGKDMQNSDYKYNKEEAAAANKITKAIKEKYGISVTGPGTLTNALFKITQDYGSRVASGEIKDDAGLMVKLEAATDTYTRNKKEWTALNDEYERLVIKNVSGDKKYQNILYTDDSGKQRLITPEVLAKEFMGLRYVNPETNRVEKISKDMAANMASSYLSGKDPIVEKSKSGFTYTNTYPVMNINGVEVPIYFSPQESKIHTIVDPSSGHTHTQERGVVALTEKLKQKYGASGKLKTDYERALGMVIPNMKYWQEKTGQMTPVASVPFSSELKNEDAVKLVQELSIGNNVANATITEADGTVRDLTPEERLAINNLMKAGESEIEKAFGTPRFKPFAGGKGSVELTLSPSLNEDYVSTNKLKELIGKAVTFNISADAQGETIKRMSVDEKFFTYGDVLRGKTVESNSALKPLGYSFTVVPNYNDERANSATIYYNYFVPNKDNPDKPIPMKVASNPIIIKGDGAVDIDQVIAEARENLVKQYKAVQHSTPKVSPASNTAVDPTSFIR